MAEYIDAWLVSMYFCHQLTGMVWVLRHDNEAGTEAFRKKILYVLIGNFMLKPGDTIAGAGCLLVKFFYAGKVGSFCGTDVHGFGGDNAVMLYNGSLNFKV
jgi:hypothetical protein